MRGKALFWWGLLLLWCAGIFWGTGDPRFTGESTRAMVAEAVPSMGVDSVRQVHWLVVSLRKLTHVVLFGTLGALAWRAFRSCPGARWRAGRVAGLAWLFATLYAASDEWHQHFVPGRTASARDVLLDSAAAAVVLLIIPGFVRYLAPRK